MGVTYYLVGSEACSFVEWLLDVDLFLPRLPPSPGLRISHQTTDISLSLHTCL